MKIFSKAPDGKTHVRLWHGPYNGGWVWFDKKQMKRFSSGWNKPTLWWCFAGFCGRLTLQSLPWGKDPGAASRRTVAEARASELNHADQA